MSYTLDPPTYIACVNRKFYSMRGLCSCVVRAYGTVVDHLLTVVNHYQIAFYSLRHIKTSPSFIWVILIAANLSFKMYIVNVNSLTVYLTSLKLTFQSVAHSFCERNKKNLLHPGKNNLFTILIITESKYYPVVSQIKRKKLKWLGKPMNSIESKAEILIGTTSGFTSGQ